MSGYNWMGYAERALSAGAAFGLFVAALMRAAKDD